MKHANLVSVLALALAPAGICQQQKSGPAPIFRITVVERTAKAINYQYRNGPTMIDFAGTALLPKGHGEATVDSKKGRTEIDASFRNLPEANRFGREYLTYVLWALTPEGRPRNIGEIVPGSSDKARIRVTTDLQAFAMIVTAEPYSAVRQPSDVVVLENQVRPDTIGKIEQVDAKYELLPRGEYTWKGPEAPPNTPKVSMREYEALTELYQAENAVGIARAAGADRYAPNTFAKAQVLVGSAERWQHSKANADRVVEEAREAAQTAEDARAIAERRKSEEQLANQHAQVVDAEQAKAQAGYDVQQAREQAQMALAKADAERVARERAETEAAAARDRAAQAEQQAIAAQSQPSTVVILQPGDNDHRKSELRMRMLEQLNGAVDTRDTPRGLVATIPDSGFSGGSTTPGVTAEVARIAAIVSSRPGLLVEVEGHTDSEATATQCVQRAEAVRGALIASGLSASAVTARGMGDSRPLVSNSTPEGREQNRRVEIVISGDAIGSLPFWDRTYSLTQK